MEAAETWEKKEGSRKVSVCEGVSENVRVWKHPMPCHAWPGGGRVTIPAPCPSGPLSCLSIIRPYIVSRLDSVGRYLSLL